MNRSTGALFTNNKKSENHPDFRGEITITNTLLREIVDEVKAGREAKLSIAAWEKVSKKGNTYLSLNVQKYEEYKPESKQEVAKEDFDSSEIPF